MPRIAICGKICSGKSYISTYLEQNYNFKKYSFGDAVKKYCKEIFGMVNKDRKLLQLFSKKMKEINNDVWINIIDQQMNLDINNNIIIDDLRFNNEYEYLKKKKFIFIKLNIDDELQKERIIETYPDNYQNHLDNRNDNSEKLIDDKAFDYEFTINKQTQNQLLQYISVIITARSRGDAECRRSSRGLQGTRRRYLG